MKKLVLLGIAVTVLVHPGSVQADAAVTQITTNHFPTAGSDKLVTQTLREIYYLKAGVQRTDTCRGVDAPPHSSAIFDKTRHRRIIINWEDHTYFMDAWNPVKSKANPAEVALTVQPTNHYKVICGYKAREYVETMSGSMLKGITGHVTEWIAKDLPGDVRSDSFGLPAGPDGMTLEGEIAAGKMTSSTHTVSITKARLPDTIFSPAISTFKRVKDLADVMDL